VTVKSTLQWFVGFCVLCGSISGQVQGAKQLSREVRSHLAAAQEAQTARDYAAAEKEYQAVLKIDPGFAEIHMNLGLVYQLQDRRKEAIQQFQAALKLKPKLTGANFFLGVDYCKEGDGAAAIPFLKTALVQHPEQVEIWSWMANAQEMTGDFRGEIVTLNRALKLHPQNVDLLYLLGQSYEHLGKQQVANLKRAAPNSVRTEQLVAEGYAASNEWPSAVIHFQNALEKNSNIAGLHVRLGEVYLHGGKVKQATAEFERELQKNPTNLRARVRRGEVSLLRGEISDALKDWNEVITTDRRQAEQILGMRENGFGDTAMEQLPEALQSHLDDAANAMKENQSPAAMFARAFIESQKGHSDAAALQESPLSASRACAPGDFRKLLGIQAYSRLANCLTTNPSPRIPGDLQMQAVDGLVQVGEYEPALKILDSLPEGKRRDSEAAYWRARCYEKLATAAYFRLYQADPKSFRVHELLGDLAASRNDDTKAIEEYRAALALNANAPNLHYSLGHVLWKDLAVPEARVELETELELNPRHVGALHDLGDSYLLEHHPEKALPYLMRASEANPENPDIHRDLGTAYVQLKDYAKAESEYKIGLAGDQDGSVHYKLAKVYQSLGKKAEADREFATYTSMNQNSHAKLERRGQRLAEIERMAE
jgi:tetratricopeptide (TPR) repeat protein